MEEIYLILRKMFISIHCINSPPNLYVEMSSYTVLYLLILDAVNNVEKRIRWR